MSMNSQGPAFSRADMRRDAPKIIALIFFVVLAPVPISSALGFAGVGSIIGLAGVGGVVAVMTVGLRIALLAMICGGVAAALLTLASVEWWSAALVMSLVALGIGLSARKGWQSGFVSLIVALSFVASDGAKLVEPVGRAAVVLATGFAAWGIAGSLITYLVFREPVFPVRPQPARHVLGYVTMLTTVTFITQGLAIGLNLGHTGGWLVMTPFLVILPQIRDGFRRSLLRAAGTIMGFLIVMALSAVTSARPFLAIFGAIMITAAIYAKFRQWDYFFYALFLTPGIVILEGLSSSIAMEAEHRLEATIGAVAISLTAMAIASLVDRRLPAPTSD